MKLAHDNTVYFVTMTRFLPAWSCHFHKPSGHAGTDIRKHGALCWPESPGMGKLLSAYSVTHLHTYQGMYLASLSHISKLLHDL
jgi:hypothetical protein